MKLIKLHILFVMLLLSQSMYAQTNLEQQKALWREMVADTVKQHNQSAEDFGDGLHEGLNVQANFSAFATMGSRMPHKGGFSEGIDALYLTPLTRNNKMWMALGGSVSHTNWGSDQYYNARLNAMLGYKFNKHWEAWLYGQLNVSNDNKPVASNYYYGYLPMGVMGAMPFSYSYAPGLMGDWYYNDADVNRIGASVRYTNGKSFSLQINVEGNWYNTNRPLYFNPFAYPRY